MSPLDYAAISAAMQVMNQAEDVMFAAASPQEPQHPHDQPRVYYQGDADAEDYQMVRYMKKRFVYVPEDEGVAIGSVGWTEVEEEVETTRDEMIWYYTATYPSASGSGSS